MSCSKQTLAWLFYNASSFFFLLLLFLYFSSVLLADILYFLYSFPILQCLPRNEYEEELFFDEEKEEEEGDKSFHDEEMVRDHLVADIICGGEALLFLHTINTQQEPEEEHVDEFIDPQTPIIEEDHQDDITFVSEDESSILESSSPFDSEEDDNEEDVVHEDVPIRDGESVQTFDENDEDGRHDVAENNCDKAETVHEDKLVTKFTKDDKFIFFAPTQLETKKFQVHQERNNKEEIFGDTTEGSTSKSSSDWRSSINYTGTEDPFSSSSRRSCPKWESYTVFQKYDEEMLFLDRLSAQKLHETEKFNSFKVCPRSISERIVHKLAPRSKGSLDPRRRQNPYHELEAAYVAQICLTWEALNWNYKSFQLLLASRREFDPGCPAHVAQQFQQFHVLLQRYVENEPYEQGKRPEIYSRIRISAPKLLQVPEYRDSGDEEKDKEEYNSRISSAAFLMIMEDGIRTFLNFLKADKEKPSQIITAFFRKQRKGLVDPRLLHLIKRENTRKKLKLKDLRRARKCFRKRSRLKWEEEVEIMLGLIDLKVVSRVLRMSDMNQEQLHWCEDKMGKVKVWEGKLQRDSSPLFFPAQ